jgi:hypothetical protein
MSLACLVYIAKLHSEASPDRLYLHKDLNTRLYARGRISGLMVASSGYIFEIMEGDYGTLESNLDRVAGTKIMEDPEIMIFSSLTKRQFQSWKMGILESKIPKSEDLGVFRMLGQQTQSSPSSTPVAVMRMLKQFYEQFAKNKNKLDAA